MSYLDYLEWLAADVDMLDCNRAAEIRLLVVVKDILAEILAVEGILVAGRKTVAD